MKATWIWTLFVFLGAAHAQQPLPSDSVQVLSSVATEGLIAKLQDESTQGIGTHTTALASGFMAINDEPKFNGGILGSAKPVISPVMRELVRRGTAALPPLIEHLSDARPTKLIVGREFMGKWFSDEYDPRDRDPAKVPPGVSATNAFTKGGREGKSFDTYTVKVGDLCFVAVGQIVNRQLNAVRYQPSLCLVINSPIETPALAAAVKADWSGLTPAEHQRSLENDAAGYRDPILPPEAIKRLLFYYPPAGDAFVVGLLERPFIRTELSRPAEVNCDNQLMLVAALAAFPSATLDHAVHDLLERAAEARPQNFNNVFARCELVHTCLSRLTEPGEREALDQSYRKIMATLPKWSYPQPVDSTQIAAFSQRFQSYLNQEIEQLAASEGKSLQGQ